MRRIFVGESFTVALISGIEKVCIRKGLYQGFPSKILCLTVPKISVGETFTVALILGTEKSLDQSGVVSRLSVAIFMSHSAENFRSGNFYCCINLGY